MEGPVTNREAERINEEREPRFVSYTLERIGAPQDAEVRAAAALRKASVALEDEWGVVESLSVPVSVMSMEEFQRGLPPGHPGFGRFCFVLRDQPDDHIYIRADIFDVLPAEEANALIKHEVGHIVVAHQVDDMDAYRSSFILEEGTAGIANADERLVARLARESRGDIPDPLALDTLEKLKAGGSNTDIEPFSAQKGYLSLFSFTNFLKERHGQQAVISLYRLMKDHPSLEAAYYEIFGISLRETADEWRALISSRAEEERKKLGEAGKEKKEQEEAAEVAEIRKKYGVK